MDKMIQSLVKVLKSLQISFVIIGGIAASLWGRPRMTLDVDLVVIISRNRILSFLKSLREVGFKISPSSEPKMIGRLQRGLPVKIRYKKGLSVDLRIASYTLDHRAMKRARKIRLFDLSLPVARPEDLIVYKIARLDDLDRADIKAILARMGKRLDTSFIRKVGEELVKETQDPKISKNLGEVLSWINQ